MVLYGRLWSVAKSATIQTSRKQRATVFIEKSDRPLTLGHLVDFATKSSTLCSLDSVGVSPKWVIRHFRLHDAASRLAKAEDVNLTSLAQDLGYADQAHFTRDFKAIVGRSPSDYRLSASSAPAPASGLREGLGGLGGNPK